MGRENITDIWGQDGTGVADPGASKIALGWLSQIPPYQWQNFMQRRSDGMLQRIEQYGIQDWSVLTTYPNTGLALGSNGVIYQSQQAANINHQPVADDGTWWEQAAYSSVQEAAGTILADGESGYMEIHGDTPLIIQWGRNNVAANTLNDLVTLPLVFPTVHALAIARAEVKSTSELEDVGAQPQSVTQISLDNAQNSATDINWLALGW